VTVTIKGPPDHFILFADEWGGVGGTAGYLVMMAQGLRQAGHSVSAICHDNPAMSPVLRALRDAGVEVQPYRPAGSLLGILRRQVALTNFIRLRRGCALILLMGYFTRGGGVALAGALGGAAAVIRADLTPPEPPVTTAQRIFLKIKDALVDRIVVGADENRYAFARMVGRSVASMTVVNTGIQLPRFAPIDPVEARAELGLPALVQVVGTVSRLSDRRKGVHDFLAMAARVSADAPAVRFLVVGDGTLRPQLERQARELGIDHRVAFAGWRSDIAKVLSAVDVFVMPSYFEGGPTTVLEAMAMGKAVVASRVGMVPEVIEDGRTGLIFPPGDVAGMSTAVSKLLHDVAMRTAIGLAAREKAKISFSVERMVERYREVAADVVGTSTYAGRQANLRTDPSPSKRSHS
jgi:glycosyltransferase involved in cell wall biosynthesis